MMGSLTITIEYCKKGNTWIGLLSKEDQKAYPELKGLIVERKVLDELKVFTPLYLNALLIAHDFPWCSCIINYKEINSD
jgi:hypothetical protein